MDILKGLGKPKEYAPIIVGATIGLVGMQYLMTQAKSWIDTVYPAQDWALWALYIGVTVAAIGVYVASRKGSDWSSRAINASSISAIAVGGFSILAKGLQWTPISIGRVGAVRSAARPVTVVRRETTPTYAHAASPAVPSHSGVEATAQRF